MKYLKRIIDNQLDLHLEAFGAVHITGPKWCGKTTTAETRAKSVIKMQDPDRSREIDDAAQHLLEITRLIKESNLRNHQAQLKLPDLLLILTAGEMAYTRPDGVKVVPIAA